MSDGATESIFEQGLPPWEDLSFPQRFWFALGVDSVAGDHVGAQESYEDYRQRLIDTNTSTGRPSSVAPGR